nr:NAD(P)-binding domain-containing protein [Acidobacteriota bacterium]
MKQIAVIGAGSWGTALGIIAGRAGHHVQLWSRNAEVVEVINRDRVNSIYLAPHEIPEGVRATNDLAEALTSAEIVLL